MTADSTTDTRAQLLQAAIANFADRGFYGTSIARIAADLGLTKQALLHHFGSKEKLYAEILAAISAEALQSIEATRAMTDPVARLEELIVRRFDEEISKPDEARLLMRELLDNEQRAQQAGNWYLKPYLEALVALLQQVPARRALADGEALAVIYQLLGAANYFAMSLPTLRHMFGEAVFAETEARFAIQLRQTVRATLAGL